MAGDDDWRDVRRRELHGETPRFGDNRPAAALPLGGRDIAVAQPGNYRGRAAPAADAAAAPRPRRWLPYAVGAGVVTIAVVGWLILDRPAPVAVPGASANALAASNAARPLCSAPETLAGLRAIVFARARHIGGPNPAWLEAQATTAVLRIDDAFLKTFDADSANAVCAGKLSLRLSGNSAAIAAVPVDYSVLPAADARGRVYTLSGADPVIRQLVELEPEPVEAPPPAPVAAVRPATPPVVKPPKTAKAVTAKPVAKAKPAAKSTGAKPKATKAVKAAAKPTKPATKRRSAAPSAAAMVGGSASLTALDNTASLLSTPGSDDDPKLTRRIAKDQSAFVARRDKCTTNDCIARAYRQHIDSLARLRSSQSKPVAAPGP